MPWGSRQTEMSSSRLPWLGTWHLRSSSSAGQHHISSPMKAYLASSPAPAASPTTFVCGDRIRGLVGDHIEPAVSARNSDPKANAGFNILSCVGNRAVVVSGDAKGSVGVVTGTHGGIEHVMIDFSDDVLAKMVIGDQIQVEAWGVGLEIDSFPNIRCTGLDPDLFATWVTETRDDKLVVPVACVAPAAIMGSGLGAR